MCRSFRARRRGVLAQIAYPLRAVRPARSLTVAIVLLVAAASLCHAAITRGRRAALALVAVHGRRSVSPSRCWACTPACRSDATSTPIRSGLAVRRAGGHRLRLDDAGVAGGARRATAGALVRRPGSRSARGRSRHGISSSIRRWSPRGTGAGSIRRATCPACRTVPLSDYLGWLVVAMLISLLLQRALDGEDAAARSLAARVLRLDVGVVDARAGRVPRSGAAAAVWGAVAMGTVAVPLRARWRVALKVVDARQRLAVAGWVHAAVNARLLRRPPVPTSRRSTGLGADPGARRGGDHRGRA